MAQSAALIRHRIVVFLCGDLGAGKTTLVRGLMRGLGYQGTVKSPTYTLVEPYHLDQVRVYHIDLYRLHDSYELEFTGLRDRFDEPALFLVEWAENALSALPEPDATVLLVTTGEGREVTFHGLTSVGARLVSGL